MLDKNIDNYAISIVALSLCAFSLNPQMLSDNEDLCIISEKDSFKLFEQDLFQDEILMSDNLFQDLLAIYLHTRSQNIIDSNYYERCISEYLCPHDYDLFSTKVLDFDSQNYWEDEYGVRYSLDGRKVIEASKQLKDVDYVIREGVITICDQAFQSKELKSILLPNSVIAIGNLAFANNDDMEYCNIPSSVKYINDNNPWGGCFNIRKMDCMSLSFIIKDGILYSSDFYIVYGFIYWNPNVRIDYRVKKISANAFWSSRKKYDSIIKKITLFNVEEIGTAAFERCENAVFDINCQLKKIGKESFYGCKKLDKVDLSKVDDIPEKAFKNCESLTHITLSSELESINSEAFQGCESLELLTIPKTAFFISERVFNNCITLHDINVDANNDYYCSIDGVLYNKSITKLIKYPSAKKMTEFIVPDTVCEIGDGAFNGCSSLETIKCSNKVLKFGDDVFAGCKELHYCYIHLDERTDSKSAWNLGFFLFSIENVADDIKQNGYYLITKAADLNNSDAQWYLARLFKFGWNGEVNMELYITWLKRSAENNNYEAMSNLARELIMGNNTSRDLNKAFDLLCSLEKSGFYAKILCKGNFYALLGVFYEKGLIVPKDTNKAVEYYKKGASWHDSVAEFMMASCYENGIGLEENLQKAKEYYLLAKKHKHSGASAALERIEKRLNSK